MAISNSPLIITNGLVLYFDLNNPNSYVGPPLTNILPNGINAGHPTAPSGWATYNTNQYNNNIYFSIGTVSSVTSNVVTTTTNHPLRTYDVVTPQTTGGGVTAGTNYLVKKLSDTTFSLFAYDSTQDSYTIFSAHNSLNSNTPISINSTNFPTMWWGPPHLPNSGIMKQIVKNGFQWKGRVHDCLRIHWYRPDGVKDGMAYGNEPTVTAGQTYTLSFYYRAATPNCVGSTVNVARWTNGEYTSQNFVLGSTWQKCSYTFTTSQSGTTYFYWFDINTPARSSWDISEIMFYQGTGSSEYVASNATRSNTQALLDLTGRNTITANSLTYASDGTFTFNGTSNYISTTISSFNMYCLNIWLYNNNAVPNNDTSIGGPSTYQTLVQFNNAYPTGINLGTWTSGMTNEAVQIWTGTSGSYTATYNQTAVPVGWHNFVFNWNGSNYDIWIDGVKTTTYTMNGGATLQTITSLQIGYSSPGYYFNGKIPIVKCYGVQLSDDQILQNFNALRGRYGL